MTRLRDANPAPLSRRSDDDLKRRIVLTEPSWSSHQQPRRSVPSKGPWQRWVAGGMVAAAMLGAALAATLSGSAPNVAQAFPVLSRPFTLTPAALQQSLKYYGVSPDNDGLDIARGRAIGTPWGSGYVLTGPYDSFICVVAPGLSSDDWGASCAQTKLATAHGTLRDEYAYDAAAHTARLLALLPHGATATMRTDGGRIRRLSLTDGLLAVDITSSTEITVTIKGRTTTARYTPRNTMPGPVSPAPAPAGMSTTATAAATTRTRP